MKKLAHIFLVFGFILALNSASVAQCSMCRQAAATNIEAGKGQGRGLNKGILFLMAIPYLLGGGAGFIYWNHKRKVKKELNKN